jgi:AraC-like DNA-binding protein
MTTRYAPSEKRDNIHPLSTLADGMLRCAPIARIVDLLDEFGIPADPLLKPYNLSRRVLFEAPDTGVRLASAGKFVNDCIRTTGCAHIGLLSGQRGGPSTMGVVGLLMRNAPDLRTALHYLMSHFCLHDRSASLSLAESGETVTLGYVLNDPRVVAADQINDHAMAVALNTVRALCGPEWKPLEVRLRRPPPADDRPYRQHFGAPLVFAATESALVFAAGWLDHHIRHGSAAHMPRTVERALALNQKTHGQAAEMVYELLLTRIGPQRCKLDQVAAHFAAHPRTLSRHLQAAGTSFRELYGRALHETARSLLRESNVRVEIMAAMLGYADATAFTRAFTKREGQSPTAWRACQAIGSGGATAVPPPIQGVGTTR